jgi:hypothetical protein
VRKFGHWSSTTLVLLIAVGCGGDGVSTPSVTVTDSAGVRIVHHAIPSAPLIWAVVPESSVTLSGDVETLPFQIGVALKLSDGRYAVADGGNHRVAFFGVLGAFAASTGRQGEGPGEFQHVTLLARGIADSLLVWDRRARRVSVLAPSGDFIRAFALETTQDVPFAGVRDVYDDGSFLATGFTDTGAGGPETGRRAYSSPSFHYGPGGEFLAQAGIFPTSESYFQTIDRGFAVYPVLFGRTAHRLAAGTRLLTATSDRYELRFLAPDGSPQMILRRDPRDRPVTSNIRRAVEDALVSSDRNDNKERLRAVLAQMDVPDILPEFSEIFADRLGRVWVQEYEPLDQEWSNWRVYDAQGLELSSIHLPGRFRLTDAGEGFVVGVSTGDLDIEEVIEFPLRVEPPEPSA